MRRLWPRKEFKKASIQHPYRYIVLSISIWKNIYQIHIYYNVISAHKRIRFTQFSVAFYNKTVLPFLVLPGPSARIATWILNKIFFLIMPQYFIIINIHWVKDELISDRGINTFQIFVPRAKSTGLIGFGRLEIQTLRKYNQHVISLFFFFFPFTFWL